MELYIAQGNHFFDYGQKESVDQMRATWEKLLNHVETIHGHYIFIELHNENTVLVLPLYHTPYVLD